LLVQLNDLLLVTILAASVGRETLLQVVSPIHLFRQI
jgi:hypothetical protein